MNIKSLILVVISFIALLGFIAFMFIPKSVNDSNHTNASQESAIKELEIIDTEVGTGKEVEPGDTVVIHYNGLLENGTKFDSSYDRGQPFETQIGVGQVIQGWDIGVVGMKEGGKRRLMIPSQLGYGEYGSPPVIPPNAGLIFDVELLEVKK
jgi:FKBP-type peptidyl-prolyl cis-trans isomerase